MWIKPQGEDSKDLNSQCVFGRDVWYGGGTCSSIDFKKLFPDEDSKKYGQEKQFNQGQNRVQIKKCNVNEGYNSTAPCSTSALKEMPPK